MKQFFLGSDSDFADLERRSRRNCIAFPNQEMPPGTTPSHARIGFDSTGRTGESILLVERGVAYTGPSGEVREWLNAGEKRFRRFGDLRRWICGELAGCYASNSVPSMASTGSEVGLRATAHELTDVDAVRDGIRDLERPLYLDESVLSERLRRVILGQDTALKSLSAMISRHCARRRPSRPAVGFAVGPSGVGKTRTAEMLARLLNELDDSDGGYGFLRLDMSEYQEAHRVSQLIGAPQGYVGHGQGSQLLDALRSNPRTIVLFDEIEKAHASILRVLMNSMDAGRLSTADRSAGGHQIDCRYAIFLFTSNLDAKEILAELDSRRGYDNRSVVDDVCRRRLNAAGIAPEIIGRIGRFLVFQPLSAESRAEIVALAVAEIAEEYGLDVARVAPSVIVELMRKARTQGFGARAERYLIDDELGGAFAAAARRSSSGRIEVQGPPHRCISIGTSSAPTSQQKESNDGKDK